MGKVGKYERKREKRSRKWIWILCLLLLAAVLVLFALPRLRNGQNEDPELNGFTQNTTTENRTEDTTAQPQESTAVQEPEETTAEAPAVQEPEETVVFPAVLEEGQITIESLFPFSGVNPDADNQDATDVASIVLINTSGRYLREATVNVTLADGRVLTFALQDIPAGASVMAFSVTNDVLRETDVCAAITVKTVFEDISKPEGLEISVDGMMITVKNTSSKKLNNLDVYYRDVFGERYFGGKAYIHSIENLSAGETVTFTAENSLLGVVDVVCAAVNDKN